MPRGKTDEDKQSSSTRMEPLVNDIQKQKGETEFNILHGLGIQVELSIDNKGKPYCPVMTYLVQSEAHAFCCKGKQDDVFLKNQEAHNLVALHDIFCCSLFKQAFIVTHIC